MTTKRTFRLLGKADRFKSYRHCKLFTFTLIQTKERSPRIIRNAFARAKRTRSAHLPVFVLCMFGPRSRHAGRAGNCATR
jgi:hypothetical protein